MRNFLLGVACFLCVSMSVTMSAQADINDYMNAQVIGTEIFMEYDHQKMLEEIDAQNVEIDALTTQLANGSNALLSSVITPAITSGATGTDLVENTGADQPVYTITAIAAWPAPTFAIGGTDFDAGSLSLNASTGVVTLTVDPVYATQSSYSFTVTATDAANNTSAATAVTFSITSLAFVNCGDPYTYDNHSYATVLIGTQCWFAENLRNEHYANGDAIPGDLSDGDWSNTTSGAVTVCGEGTSTVYSGSDDEVSNLADYGRLYNWYAVDDARGLCPSGWHVPQDSEFKTLEMELGMSESEANLTGYRGTDQGTQMKSSACDSPAWNGTNTSGLSGLAGGTRDNNGDFYSGGDNGYFWSASASGTNAWSRILNGGNTEVARGNNSPRYGFSVRCVRD